MRRVDDSEGGEAQASSGPKVWYSFAWADKRSGECAGSPLGEDAMARCLHDLGQAARVARHTIEALLWLARDARERGDLPAARELAERAERLFERARKYASVATSQQGPLEALAPKIKEELSRATQ